MIQLLAVALTGIGLGAATYLLIAQPTGLRAAALANATRPARVTRVDADEPVDVFDTSSLGRVARRLTPGFMVRVLEKQHRAAGYPKKWNVSRLLVAKFLWLPFAALIIAAALLSDLHPILRVIAMLVPLVIYFLPELLLNSEAEKRREKIDLALPDTLDQMLVAVDAGLGFDTAMARAAQAGKGPLADELTRTLQDMQMGQSRREAFLALADRTDVRNLRRVLRTLIQADTYGVPISGVLRNQATDMRAWRRARAEEQAQKVPVKVLMPLMVCILPVLMIVVIGPAVLEIIATFSELDL